ncbi:hypothetical protein [Paenibacillus sp. 32352]|uniref:hypothetical protein n=1 Tax=Paenibacillus sp. 32352 TaxID=1969111 RepID=UPI00277B4DC7|nr:hypothetical protein [Paenibacillus sp. 32352]
MKPIMERLTAMNDEWSQEALLRQVHDPHSKYAGGILDDTGTAQANHLGTPAFMAVWTAALVNPASRYYRDEVLLQALEQAAQFMLSRQHADGTISLGATNYHSPPDTGFVIGGVVPVVQLLQAHEEGWPELGGVISKLKLFLGRTIPAMLTGGCHTPNHRWVITAALGLLYELFGRPELAARADEWLNEGIDITADGEWTERSNGIYNAVSDIALYHTARTLNRPEWLDAVRRNLRMMVYLVHPSGEVVTDYSGRQDYGQQADLASYALIYRLMAAMDRDPLFAAMSDYAASFIKQPGAVNNSALLGYLLVPELQQLPGIDRSELPQEYKKFINAGHPIAAHLRQLDSVGHHQRIQHSSMHLAFGAPIVRIREGLTSVTLMSQSPSFFSLRHGDVRLLGVKLSTSFSPGIVKFDDLAEKQEMNSFKLTARRTKGYNGPIPDRLLPGSPADRLRLSPWYLLPHQHRPLTHEQTLRLSAELTQGDTGWKLRLRSEELEDVYTQLTFIFSAEAHIAGEDLHQAGPGSFFLKSGAARIAEGQDALEIAGGAYEHWLPVLREDEHPAGCQYVHLNLMTPFDRTFTITFS